MSEYNAKNYTEQGGDVTHIGGKLVIDDGADISALAAAIKDAGKMTVCDLSQSFGNRSYSDMVGEDTKILAGGIVSGTIKYVAGYDKFSGGEQDGYFFPAHLSDEYKEQGDHGHLPGRHGDTGITDTRVGMALGYGRVSFFR